MEPRPPITAMANTRRLASGANGLPPMLVESPCWWWTKITPAMAAMNPEKAKAEIIVRVGLTP